MTYILAIVCSALFLAADQLSKYYVVNTFTLGETKPAIDGIFDFTYIHNTGGAWGMLSGHTAFLLIFTAVAMALCVYLLVQFGKDNKLLFWAICLVIGGGLGNMIDRLFRGGKVVDFIRVQFIDFPIFNIADCAVVIGGGLLMLCFVLDIVATRKQNKLSEQTDEAE